MTTQPVQPAADTYQHLRAGAAALADVVERTRHVPVFAVILNDDEGEGRPSIVLDVLDYGDAFRAAAALGLVQSLISLDGPSITEWRGTITAAGAPIDVIVRAYDVPPSPRAARSTVVRLLVALMLGVPAALFIARTLSEGGAVVAVAVLAVGWIIAPSNAAILALYRAVRRSPRRARSGGAR